MPKGDTKTKAKNMLFAPRAVMKPRGWNKKDDEKPDVAPEELKSNDEFRNLLLKK